MKIQYPATRREDRVEMLHGLPVADPYRWLEDDRSPETEAWVKAQNEVTQAYLDRIPARDRIRRRLTELWDYEKFGVPTRHGGRYFFTYNDGLQNQSVVYWLDSLAGEQSAPRQLLDPNRLSTDGTLALTGAAISDDGQYMAYGLSEAGSDWQEWRVRRVDSGEDLPDWIRWVKFSEPSWDLAGHGFYYSRYAAPVAGQAYKDTNYDQKLYYHRLGSPQEEDVLVYERPDQKEWGFNGQVSHDGRFLVITVWQGTQQENGLFYQDLRRPGAPVVELFNRFDAAYGYLGSDGSRFYIYTDYGAPFYRVVAVDLDHPEPGAWMELVPESGDTIQFARIVGNRLLVAFLHDAYSLVKEYGLDGRFLGNVDFPGLGSVAGFSGQRTDRETFYLYTSYTTPGTVYHYDLDSRKSSLFRQPVLRFDPAEYVTEQVFFASKNGARVPMFLVHRRDRLPDGQNPTFLYGYGGFNIATTPAFTPANLLWLEMGGLLAYVNLRGGGEYGKAWHEAGMKANKQNVFDDFIAAAEWLIANQWTSTSRLSIYGRSNGGLLAAACLTQRPDLFGAAVVVVGVLDMLRFHKFTIGWAWVSEYGSPDDPSEIKALRAYSPYHNLRPGTTYPPTLITTGDHDDRVFPAHSFKFAAALQSVQAGPAPALIRIDVRAGHGPGKPTTKLIEEWADTFAFLAYNLNMGNS